GNTWIQQTVNMAPYAGMTVRIKFLVHQDGFGDDTAMYVDDVSLPGGCGGASPTPTATGTPSATPTCVPAAGQITTLFASNNFGNLGGANYFDLTVASNPISIT